MLIFFPSTLGVKLLKNKFAETLSIIYNKRGNHLVWGNSLAAKQVYFWKKTVNLKKTDTYVSSGTFRPVFSKVLKTSNLFGIWTKDLWFLSKIFWPVFSKLPTILVYVFVNILSKYFDWKFPKKNQFFQTFNEKSSACVVKTVFCRSEENFRQLKLFWNLCNWRSQTLQITGE